MNFSEVFENLLNSSNGDETFKESIAKSIADKAAAGDINAVKFLRDLVDEKDTPSMDIKITVVE